MISASSICLEDQVSGLQAQRVRSTEGCWNASSLSWAQVTRPTDTPQINRDQDRYNSQSAAINVFVDPEDPRMRMPVEQSISVYLNDIRVMSVQGSPFNLDELGVGLLLSEGFIKDRNLLSSVVVDRRRHLVYVSSSEEVSPELLSREKIITSGCGTGESYAFIDGLQALGGDSLELRVRPEVLLRMMNRLSKEGIERNTTGGVHGCALADNKDILAIREDIGRHNAIDKLLGYAWIQRISTENLILISTGRISYDMAIKSARSKIPLIVSRHGITTQAAEMAKALRITAVSYCRGNKMTVLSYPERIVQNG